MQNKIRKFVEKYNLNCSIETRFIDLTSEIGELGKEILKGNNYGKQKHVNTNNIENEIGDCLFSLLAICNELNVDANEALAGSLDKYKARFDSKGNVGSNN